MLLSKIKIRKRVAMQSLRKVSLKIIVPILIAIAGLLVCLIWGLAENRKLANKYIGDTAGLYVEQINKDIFQINNELILLLNDKERDISALPAVIGPQDGRYYQLLRNIIEQNRVLKIRYSEVKNFYVYGHEANILITDIGTCFNGSTKTDLNKSLMEFLKEKAAQSSLSTQWELLHIGEDNYIVSWYAKDKKAIGCIILVDKIFQVLKESAEGYEVVPFMREKGGNIIIQSNLREQYRRDIIEGKGKGKLYSYQLGSVGKISLYVVPGGRILDNIFNMQVIFIVLIVLLLLVFVAEIYFYYRRIMGPMESFANKLEETDEEQFLNENGTNNILELETANTQFRNLLRKIQSLKIAIYEKELNEQKAELEYVQEQIKPHFFLNCLSLIHGIADTSGENQIIQITEVLSDYIRYIYKDSTKLRLLGEELEHIQSYVEIQKMRYGAEAFRFEVIKDAQGEAFYVPALLMQTLVENAFVHEMTLDHSIDISVYIACENYEEREYLYLCVSDTGKGFSEETLKAIDADTPIFYNGRKHVGLQNIRRRLKLLYGDTASISFSNMDKGYGAVAEVRIPMDLLTAKQ